MSNLIEEANSIFVQGHDMLKSHIILCLANTSYLGSLKKWVLIILSNPIITEIQKISECFFKNHRPQLTAKKLEPNKGQTERVSKTFCLARVVVSFDTPSSQDDCTMLTHCGGLMSRADNAGFGSKNLVSLMVGLWSISAALCNKAAICAEKINVIT